MKKNRFFCVAVIFSLLLIFGHISAQEPQKNSFSTSRTNMGVKLGLSIPFKGHYGLGFCYGINFGFHLSQKMSLELTGLSYMTKVTFEENDLNSGNLTAYPIQLSIRYQFSKSSRFNPYILAGIDYILFHHKIEFSDWEELNFSAENKVKNGLGFHGGVGADYFLSRHFSINVDCRYIYCQTEADWTISDTNYSDITASGTISNLQIDGLIVSLGFKIHF